MIKGTSLNVNSVIFLGQLTSCQLLLDSPVYGVGWFTLNFFVSSVNGAALHWNAAAFPWNTRIVKQINTQPVRSFSKIQSQARHYEQKTFTLRNSQFVRAAGWIGFLWLAEYCGVKEFR